MTATEKQKAKERAIETRRWGGDLEDCALQAGVTDDTIRNWRKEDLSFSEGLEAAWSDYKISLIRSVKADKPDYLLERDFRKRFHIPKEDGGNVTNNLIVMGDDALAKYLYGFVKDLSGNPEKSKDDADRGESTTLPESGTG